MYLRVDTIYFDFSLSFPVTTNCQLSRLRVHVACACKSTVRATWKNVNNFKRMWREEAWMIKNKAFISIWLCTVVHSANTHHHDESSFFKRKASGKGLQIEKFYFQVTVSEVRRSCFQWLSTLLKLYLASDLRKSLKNKPHPLRAPIVSNKPASSISKV